MNVVLLAGVQRTKVTNEDHTNRQSPRDVDTLQSHRYIEVRMDLTIHSFSRRQFACIITTASRNGVAEALNFSRSARPSRLESELEQAIYKSTTPSLTSAPSTPCLVDPLLNLHAARGRDR